MKIFFNLKQKPNLKHKKALIKIKFRLKLKQNLSVLVNCCTEYAKQMHLINDCEV